MKRTISSVLVLMLLAQSACIFSEENNTNNTPQPDMTSKDMRGGDMSSVDQGSKDMDPVDDMGRPDMTNPIDSTKDLAPDIPPPEDMPEDQGDPGSGLRIFMTKGRATLQQGLEGADEACNADERYPGDGQFKAMLGSPTRRPCFGAIECAATPKGFNWVLQPNQEYVRYSAENNRFEVVFTTNARAKFITLSGRLDDMNLNFATGFTKEWELVPPDSAPGDDCVENVCRTTCRGWTSPAPTVQPDERPPRKMAVGWTDHATSQVLEGGSAQCGKARILCVEQPVEF